jgi:DNA polymerase II large subunit
LYEIANEAHLKGFDVETEIEIPLAKDLAERVEGLVGPVGIAKRIKELESEKKSRELVAFTIAAEIASQEVDKEHSKEQLADQGLRTALAILTEGVVAAPLEGISQVKIKKNFDGSDYLAVYFAGPIRSAGGTAAALAVLLGDYIKKATGLSNYVPIDAEIERYVEEAELYESEVTNLQYSPKPEELRLAITNMPVEVTGEQTDKIEVSHRDLERVETNNIRGGALLAIAEGVIQKSSKILKYAHDLNLENWDWLENFSKAKEIDTKENKDAKEDSEDKPKAKYIEDIIGGRPVLGYPNEKGAFRLRYGRSRNTGLAAMGVNPATMELLEFLAVGTQLKIERPGKGCCVVPVDSIEGPIVKLKNGNVLKIKSIQEAKKFRKDVSEILFLGDMLIAFGEFLRNNQNLLPSAWCFEWWLETILHSEEYKKNGFTVNLISSENKDVLVIDSNGSLNLEKHQDLEKFKNSYISAKTSFEISKKYNVPLNPDYTYHYNDISTDDLNSLITYIISGEDENSLSLDLTPEKRILEVIGVPHEVKNGKIILNEDNSYSLLNTLKGKIDSNLKSVIDRINSTSEVKIMDKAPIYIGSRVGRPEKSKERTMKPSSHVLYPVGTYGGTQKLVFEAAKNKYFSADISNRVCNECNFKSNKSLCPKCGSKTRIEKPSKKKVSLSKLLTKATENVHIRQINEIKGVKSMTSEFKLPEPLEKGILRAKNQVFIFRDGTIRHDSTDLPLTHFIPKEIAVTVEKLKELGYSKDIYGDDIENLDQIIELKVQDVVVSRNCGDYLVKVSNFLDDLLERFYKMERFYNVSVREDLIGHLIVGLAPHTSAGVLGRIVGFTSAYACYAHPYFHSAKRRNCDSDEDSIMLLLDVLLNFSKTYLPSTRGGTMDAPLILSSRIDPEEIDDESHKIDIIEKFPIEFFEKTYDNLKPTEVLDLIDNVGKHLGTPEQYKGLMFSHNTTSIDAGPNICLYKTLNSMREKVDAQISLAESIRAVDQQGVVEGVLSSHFLPDIMGNSRTFSKQKVRCTKCGAKYRRIPLTGKCKCGNNLILTVSKGSVMKYLEISKELVAKYPISPYLIQRIEIQEFSVNSLFESDKSKQTSLDTFF